MEAKSKLTTNFACGECGQIVSSQQHHDFTNCESFKAGERKVAEQLKAIIPLTFTGFTSREAHTEFEAKLKEWGI